MQIKIVKKATLYPSSYGVYYCVPELGFGNWSVLSLAERDPQTGTHNYPSKGPMWFAHSNLYQNVIDYFNAMFSVDVSDIGRRCLPRGRLIGPEMGDRKTWTIQHGGDTPKHVFHIIVNEFGLENVNPQFEAIEFESMLASDKNALISRVPQMKALFDK